jgi:antitoxin ParD1/3/4
MTREARFVDEIDEEPAIMPTSRINTRLSRPLAEFVESLVGEAGLYETPSEYVRDLIRRDMEQREGRVVRDAILSGYRDLAEGAVFPSTGDFEQDMQVLAEKDADGWR